MRRSHISGNVSSSSQPTIVAFERVPAPQSNSRLLGMIALTAVIVFFTSDVEHTIKVVENDRKEPIQKMQAVPSVAEIESTLLREHMIIHGDFIVEETKNRLTSLAHAYALTYKLIQELQNQHISVTLTFGSHLGALRHHGVIPFDEKDIDLAVFSTDAVKIKRAMQTALDTQPHLKLTINEADFGYQIFKTKTFLTYIDVWMFKNIESKELTCVGHQLPDKSCERWYKNFHARLPPVYPYDAWFPVRTELFGTERVPIPATNIPIESRDFEYNADGDRPNFWNTTCGPHRRWNETESRWIEVDMSERKCSDKYSVYPFVFKMENGIEQLRQGSVVIHEVAGVTS
eukprot:CAMPEP_0201698860 /NCGR_PEP_ID=MMETSP0578-20130828/21218_1 /ASSEMBLY_ACC=CAM_ASM_000663 /TAXON_ID=267565 /ORGANISM="Skeletonema grethea, Strain CCMP 1804" /LENGTH=344 /DNA_ID=CAMNT_0048185495 /DNA_START=202 /DNA_END=1236 /DNA_ORIENTATION=-